MTDVTGVGIRIPPPAGAELQSLPCVKAAQCSHWVVRSEAELRCQRSALTEGLSKATFRAPARGAFPFYASGGLFSFSSERKEEKKRRQKLRFWIFLRGFTWFLFCLLLPHERCSVQISPKCCIVSASLSAAALTLKWEAAQFHASMQKYYQPAAKGRQLPLPLRGKGAI